MTRPVLTRVLALLVAGLVAVACGIDTGGGTPEENPPAASGDPGGPSGDDDDGTMTADEFKNDIQDAAESAEAYWSATFKQSGERFQPVRRIISYTRDGEVDCGGEPVPRNNAVYCPDGDFIAYDVNFAVAAFQQVGDAFLYYLLGHEYAHAIQQRLGVQHRLTIDHELQADCMAGAYLGDSVRGKALQLAEGDLDEFQRGLLAVGDDPSVPWFTPGAHGTAEQRTESFFLGYERSLDACDLS
ncbi:neutral zinc metallopeptidase [Asanoa sp. WMMD1127]|uniref:neutral zinc metallopeptidase n=1 Tax=Asanoa sp. WMMD1127 TaxID=3016107 RepID=UPI002416C681|nr:neutral zinc metallopeptidase [Asanoa sp. WMMD1127]MDG4826430.1 neutral zinc metallopeptidase [Asanoa sp. WMMD1127]